MALRRLCDKADGLFLSLSLVTWKPHPLPNNGPARLLLVQLVTPPLLKRFVLCESGDEARKPAN
jgi:hypothetical protein